MDNPTWHEPEMECISKFPSTPHLSGSRLQRGDSDSSQVPYSSLRGRHIVVEEKIDGANSGIRFGHDASLLLQSRGHYLSGGGRERHFDLFKAWAFAHEEELFVRLGERFLMYGEWAQYRHTIFYDMLPHFFLEFDVLDTSTGKFLSTAARRELLQDSPVLSVPVLYEGPAPGRVEELVELVRPSLAKSMRWRDNLAMSASMRNLDPKRAMEETEDSDMAEGLYIKIEEGDETVGRLKWVRHDFVQTMIDGDTHWLSRPMVPNLLAPGVDIFSPSPPAGWPASPPIGGAKFRWGAK